MKCLSKVAMVGLMFGAPMALSINAFAGTEIKLSTQTISTVSPVRQKEFSATNTEWIVQYKNHITEVDKKNLNSNGFKVYSYIPEDALIVRGSAAGVQILNKNANVQAIIPYSASMKISPAVGALSSMLTETRQTFIVSLFEASDLKSVANSLKNISKNIILNLSSSNSLVVTAARGDLTQIASLAAVENIQPYFQVEPLKSILTADDIQDTPKGPGDYSDINGFETGTKVMNFDAAWAVGLHGEDQIVGMADTGLDSGNAAAIHKDFTGAVKSGYAVGLFGKNWSDPMGHGTHVAGSVLGRGTASGGLLHGGAYAAQIVVQGMWSPMLNNLSVPADLGKMFSQAYADGARVHTNSWGSAASFGSYDKMAATVDQVMFEKQDMLILFAAGNSGLDKNRDGRIDPNSIGSPGTAKNALTVGASENLVSNGGNQKKVGELASSKDNWPVAPITLSTMSDNVNGLAMFSSRGPTADGRTKPEIVAPGTNILSVHSQQPGVEPLWGLYNNDYAWSGGTSMATPLTAGAAAVTRQYLLKSFAKPSAALVKAYMVHNATEMFPGQYGAIGAAAGQELLTLRPNSDEGFGLVNMAKIVNPTGMQMIVDNTDGVATAGVYESKFSLTKGGHLMATLVWTDAPGSTSAAKALVNDLDLEVVLPNGQVLAVNDAINNHAFVQGDVAAGEITIRVKGVNVPMGINGKQPFAIVASIQ